jgi:uncharacterized caspase-like protein
LIAYWIRALALALVLASILKPADVDAQERHAIVIGIDAYANLPPMRLAVADANAVGTALTAIGFRVTTLANPGREQIIAGFSALASQLRSAPSPTVVVYIASHGVEVGGRNFIFAADSNGLKSVADVKLAALPLNLLTDMLHDAGAKAVVLVYDSCRDTPAGMNDALVNQPVAPPRPGFVLYSSAAGRCPNEVAATSGPPATVFAAALARNLAVRGRDLSALAQAVQLEVSRAMASAGHDQRPSFYNDLAGEVVHLAP